MRSIFTGSYSRVRGVESIPLSPQFKGRFGRMCRTIRPAHFDEAQLRSLASAIVAECEPTQTPETGVDAEENTGISAGYTYLSQFIDHDLTFDPASSLEKQNEPDALVDFRTPRFDLDCIYSRGADDQPYLYEADGMRMLLGRPLTGNPHDSGTRDVPRNAPASGPKCALLGDPHNDENVIVSQLQATFLRFHNRMVNHTSILVDKPDLRFYNWRYEPFISIEFSVAAYRFGHSMVRPIYRLNTTLRQRQEIFALAPSASLIGFREFPALWAIEWNLFFHIGPAPDLGPERVQPAYKIDSSLVNPLGNLTSLGWGNLLLHVTKASLCRGEMKGGERC